MKGAVPDDVPGGPGWLPPPSGKRVDEIVDFPAMLRFKIVGVDDDRFVSDMERICGDVTGRPVTATHTRSSGKGKFRSVTVDLVLDSAQDFYRVYDAVGKDSRVKFMI